MDAPEQGSLVCDVFVPSKVPLSDRWFAPSPPSDATALAEALAAARVTAGGHPSSSSSISPTVVDTTTPRVRVRRASYAKVACVGKDHLSIPSP